MIRYVATSSQESATVMHELPSGMSEPVGDAESFAAIVGELAAELDGGPFSSQLAWWNFTERIQAIAQQFTMDPSEVLAAVMDASVRVTR